MENSKLFMYTSISGYFEKCLNGIYRYKDTDSIFIGIIVPEGSTIEQELEKIHGILSNTEIIKLKNRKPNDTIIEVCFLRAKS